MSARVHTVQNTSAVVFGEVAERLRNETTKILERLDVQASLFYNETVRIRDQSGLRSAVNTSFRLADILPSMEAPTFKAEVRERVGVRMSSRGAKVHSPVLMIPGIITTALEVWDGEDCIRSYFRQRIWGSTSMMRSIMSDPSCWARHLALNSTTGLDPLQGPHFNRSIRVRPSQGFESADFFVGGYWIWGIMIEALADIGYDLNSMHMASYDWRLSFADLERRDRYFTRLRQHIETLVSMNGQKAVVVSHSMGSNVWHYFMQWVTHRVHKNWVHDHVSAEIAISAPLLGLPKAFYSLLTGDNRDFASMGRGFSMVMTHMFGPMMRRQLWRSCSSLAMIIPIGGEEIWGENVTGHPLIRIGDLGLNATASLNLLAAHSNIPSELKRIEMWLLDGARRSKPSRQSTRSIEAPLEHLWGNVLASPLPFAPDLQKYAFYGVGVPTEVSAVVEDSGDDIVKPKYGFVRDATQNVGFELGNGDFAVPLRSLGLMCAKGWKNRARNPAGTPCTIREYANNPDKNQKASESGAQAWALNFAELSPGDLMSAILSGGYNRGGQTSGDHIDILGNEAMLEDVLTIVSGGHVEERVVSEIQDIAGKWTDGARATTVKDA